MSIIDKKIAYQSYGRLRAAGYSHDEVLELLPTDLAELIRERERIVVRRKSNPVKRDLGFGWFAVFICILLFFVAFGVMFIIINYHA